MPTADASGVPIHYDLAGSGPLPVMLQPPVLQRLQQRASELHL
ncbi:MAG TPA: hypothetical protein VHM23_08135 [Actinomycetota bacterium]|jgi:hypothetical protein|nr:hypothetical protein [Actinomycetota bacterium]